MSEERDYYRPPRRKYGRSAKTSVFSIVSKLFALVATGVTGLFVYQAMRLNMLPIMYLAVGATALVVLLLLVWLLVFRRGTAAKAIGALFAILICAGLGLGTFFLRATETTLEKVTGTTRVVQTDKLSFLVLKNSALASLNDLAIHKLGVQSVMDRTNTDKALSDLAEKIGAAPATEEYNGVADMVQSLYDKQVDAILFNESYRDLVKDEYPEFDSETRVLDEIVYETEVELANAETEDTTDVTSEPFIIYFSGIDTYGSIAARSRSDVNIMAVVNPSTKQILLVTTPRDYYVELPVAGNAMDKLTHAGIYGIDASIDTLEQLYDISINYYVRLNFTGFMNIVDALGGVDVYSSRSFTGEVYGYHFDEGMNHVNGEQALSFVRERHSFADGDFQRQRNQMEMIRAIVKKAASPAILTSYTALLKGLEDSFTTDITADKISDIVKMQLAEGGEWNVQSYGVSGKGARRTTYSMGSRSLYVALQDPDSIAEAKGLIERVLNGEILSDSDSKQGNQE